MTSILSIESFFPKIILTWFKTQAKQIGDSFNYMRATLASENDYDTISYAKIV